MPSTSSPDLREGRRCSLGPSIEPILTRRWRSARAAGDVPRSRKEARKLRSEVLPRGPQLLIAGASQVALDELRGLGDG